VLFVLMVHIKKPKTRNHVCHVLFIVMSNLSSIASFCINAREGLLEFLEQLISCLLEIS